MMKTKKLTQYFKIKRQHKLNRSRAGNALLFFIMIVCGIFMVIPLVMILNNAFKPFDELFRYPPKLFVKNPTFKNFKDLFVLMNNSWVSFGRYIINTIIITGGGTIGHILIASMAAYPLAKMAIPGKKLLFASRGVPLERFAISTAPSESILIPKTLAERFIISVNSFIV